MTVKFEKLKRILKEYGNVAIAFSSGVDSTFLLKTAIDTLGAENVVAVTISSCFIPEKEKIEAERLCENMGVKHIIIDQDVLSIDGIKENPKDRCYLCKKTIFTNIMAEADKQAKSMDIDAFIICEGSNADDISDYRPGMRAIKELGIKSPLMEAGLTKAEIRSLSKELNLPTFNKPSMACLASRFVYGEELTEEKLDMVEKAEDFVMNRLPGVPIRVRIHGDKPNITARIEVPKEYMKQVVMMEDLAEHMHGLGFSYVTLDIDGFRSGSMNETLNKI